MPAAAGSRSRAASRRTGCRPCGARWPRCRRRRTGGRRCAGRPRSACSRELRVLGEADAVGRALHGEVADLRARSGSASRKCGESVGSPPENCTDIWRRGLMDDRVVEDLLDLVPLELVDVADLVGVHEARVAHHVAAVGQVDREHGAAAVLDRRGAVVVQRRLGDREVAARIEPLEALKNAGSIDMTSSKCPCLGQSFFITIWPSSSTIGALISPGLPSMRTFQSTSPERICVAHLLHAAGAERVGLARPAERREACARAASGAAPAPTSAGSVPLAEAPIDGARRASRGLRHSLNTRVDCFPHSRFCPILAEISGSASRPSRRTPATRDSGEPLATENVERSRVLRSRQPVCNRLRRNGSKEDAVSEVAGREEQTRDAATRPGSGGRPACPAAGPTRPKRTGPTELGKQARDGPDQPLDRLRRHRLAKSHELDSRAHEDGAVRTGDQDTPRRSTTIVDSGCPSSRSFTIWPRTGLHGDRDRRARVEARPRRPRQSHRGRGLEDPGIRLDAAAEAALDAKPPRATPGRRRTPRRCADSRPRAPDAGGSTAASSGKKTAWRTSRRQPAVELRRERATAGDPRRRVPAAAARRRSRTGPSPRRTRAAAGRSAAGRPADIPRRGRSPRAEPLAQAG